MKKYVRQDRSAGRWRVLPASCVAVNIIQVKRDSALGKDLIDDPEIQGFFC